MQDVRGERSPKDDHPPIGVLPRKNIDTGLGVERVATLLQGVDSVYDTDLVRPVIARAEEMSGRRYGADPVADVRFRVIADHARSGVMIIGDGVTPGNEGRGYVLRRLLRRIVRSARLLGVTEPVLQRFAEVVRDEMSPSYPELGRRLRAHLRGRARRGGGVPRHADRGVADLRHGRGRHEAGGRHPAGGRPRVRAARHLRLPDRPHAGDGGRGRADRRRAGLPHADGRAAGPGQGRRERPQDRARRRRRVPRGAGRGRRDRVPRLHRPDQRVADRRARRRRGRRAGGRGGHGRRGRAGPHPLLRRGRWPAGRHRRDPRRRVQRGGDRRADARSPDWSCTAAPSPRARPRWTRSSRRRSTPAGGPRCRARTRRPTSCTRACASTWATPRRRPAR